jgi:hypothetical protein
VDLFKTKERKREERGEDFVERGNGGALIKLGVTSSGWGI